MVAMRVDLGWRSNVEASVKGGDFGKKKLKKKSY
jgi:hypothetical protein